MTDFAAFIHDTSPMMITAEDSAPEPIKSCFDADVALGDSCDVNLSTNISTLASTSAGEAVPTEEGEKSTEISLRDPLRTFSAKVVYSENNLLKSNALLTDVQDSRQVKSNLILINQANSKCQLLEDMSRHTRITITEAVRCIPDSSTLGRNDNCVADFHDLHKEIVLVYPKNSVPPSKGTIVRTDTVSFLSVKGKNEVHNSRDQFQSTVGAKRDGPEEDSVLGIESIFQTSPDSSKIVPVTSECHDSEVFTPRKKIPESSAKGVKKQLRKRGKKLSSPSTAKLRSVKKRNLRCFRTDNSQSLNKSSCERIQAKEISYSCKYCDKSFSKKGIFELHEKSHAREKQQSFIRKKLPQKSQRLKRKQYKNKVKKHACSHCNKKFTYIALLIQHERTHSGEKPYSCRICNKSFTLKGYCLIHEKLHEGGKPYSCTYCEKSFTQKSICAKHERLHTGEKLLICKQCGKEFTDKSKYTRHERVHTGERPFSCKYCYKAFTEKAKCVRHEKIHTGERPFPCTQCSKSFTRKTALARHQESHAIEKPFSCTYCNEKFSEKSLCMAHLKIHFVKKLSVASAVMNSSEAFKISNEQR